jgi:hypothetical protein
MCCPEGTRFDSATCACDEDATCTDSCSQNGPAVGTTVKPASQFNSTVCQDSFGTYIAASTTESNAYFLIDTEGHATEKLYCPASVTFSLSACRCDIIDETATPGSVPQRRQATLWVNYISDALDHSVNKFIGFLYDGASYDASVGVFGGGSLFVNGGYHSFPGLKNYDSRNAGSFCGFFRCESGNGFSCTSSGGILSNNKDSSDSEYTVIFANQASNSFTGRLSFWQPTGLQAVNTAISTPSNGWNSFCTTYDGNTVTLYFNGAVAASSNIAGYLSIAHCPYVIGTDQSFGTFTGHVGPILITPFAMTAAEVNAFSTGNFAALQAEGFW